MGEHIIFRGNGVALVVTNRVYRGGGERVGVKKKSTANEGRSVKNVSEPYGEIR